MKWRKLGRTYAPSGAAWWARSHAFIPTPHVVGDGRIRVYVTALDDAQYGRIGWVDVDEREPTRVLDESREPVLSLGPIGSFDDSGVNASSVLVSADAVHLYYIGWQRARRVPYMLFSGLARAASLDGPFERVQRVPVLDRTPDEPFSRSAPFVTHADGRWRCWFWSCLAWTTDELGVHYNNVIREAESADGVRWDARPAPLLEPTDADYSLGRPWVVRSGQEYRMWYSIRSRREPYRLGLAISHDGHTWTRADDRVGLTRSEHGWDSEMVCFPAVVSANGRQFMFYNGNGHGRTGFGVAELEQDD